MKYPPSPERTPPHFAEEYLRCRLERHLYCQNPIQRASALQPIVRDAYLPYMFFECAMSERICWTRYTIIFRNEMANFRAKTTKREEVNTTYSLESVSCLQPKINHCSRKGYCVAGLTASSMAFLVFCPKLIPEANIFTYTMCGCDH